MYRLVDIRVCICVHTHMRGILVMRVRGVFRLLQQGVHNVDLHALHCVRSSSLCMYLLILNVYTITHVTLYSVVCVFYTRTCVCVIVPMHLFVGTAWGGSRTICRRQGLLEGDADD